MRNHPSRRSFLRSLAALGTVWGARLRGQMEHAASASPLRSYPVFSLEPFVDALPLPQVLHGRGRLKIRMREIHAKLHRDLPPTRMWSYGETALAPLIDARAGQPLEIEWINDLPKQHFLPIDHSLHGSGREVPDVRTVVHVHGARVPTKWDGYPEDWFEPGASLTCTYPLRQDAATLWYHDHAMGVTRLNHYAGLFGLFLLRDAAEDALHLPSGRYELPLILYDRNLTTDAQLLYPTSGDPEHPWVSEFNGDAIVINGKIRPFCEVEPRLYRLRAVNAANSRFFRLSFAGLGFHQIGADQGLLPAPVPLQVLTLAPGERADLLVDFSAHAGDRVHLQNGALGILQFRIAGKAASAARPMPVALRRVERLAEAAAVRMRSITLNEYKDKTGNSMVMLLNRMHWHEPVTEIAKLGSTEIWEFLNLTDDTHPMHLHAVRFQVLDRRPFDVFTYLKDRVVTYTAPAAAPAANEMGWKDVVQCSPGVVTRIAVRFEGYAGRYVYHCHILEHEANDMMRPFEIRA